MTTNGKHTRRRFLQSSLLMAGGAALAGQAGLLRKLAHAAPGDADTFYVFAVFEGGWDGLLSLDPRDPAVFTRDRVDDTQIELGYERLGKGDLVRPAGSNITFGPYIGDLAAHYEKLAVVRGLSMETLTHGTAHKRFQTGKPPAGLNARGSSGAVWLTGMLEGDQPIPNLSVGIENYNKNLPPHASAVLIQGSDDLRDILSPQEPTVQAAQDEALARFLDGQDECARSRDAAILREAALARKQRTKLLNDSVADLFDMERAENTPLVEHFGIQRRKDVRTSQVQAAMAAQALVHGISRCISIRVGDQLDTHDGGDWQSTQGDLQETGFNSVARLIEWLQAHEYADSGESWFDHTVILGFSEFQRTPRFNDSGGRDHWPTNSCFLTGGRIRGNQVIGASSDVGMRPLATDLGTGRPDPGGEILRPEHIWRTLLVDAGVSEDVADLRVDPLPVLLR